MPGGLTTHVLDTSSGTPASGVRVDLYRCDAAGDRTLIRSIVTNTDGRAVAPLASGVEFAAGLYELVFHAADYFRSRGANLPEPPFLDLVSIRFGVADPSAKWHVPLLLSPYGYTTYRGS
jgi:5-hydroxyisourate hydrolase